MCNYGCVLSETIFCFYFPWNALAGNAFYSVHVTLLNTSFRENMDATDTMAKCPDWLIFTEYRLWCILNIYFWGSCLLLAWSSWNLVVPHKLHPKHCNFLLQVYIVNTIHDISIFKKTFVNTQETNTRVWNLYIW